MQEIKIQLSKTKLVAILLGSVLFVVIGFWMLQYSDRMHKLAPLLIQIIAIAATLLSGLCGLYAIIKLFDNKPGLVINDKGIFDNSSAINTGLIKWENITHVYISEISGQEFLTIEVNNAEELFLRQTGLKKLMLKWSKDWFGSPVQISSNALKCDFNELCEIIDSQLQARHSSDN